MPVTAQWDNPEQTQLLLDFAGKWTWEEFNEANKALSALLDSVTHKVDLIADVTKSAHLPPGALTHARSVMANSRPNRGLMMIVGANTLIKMFYPVLKKLYGERMRLPEMCFAPDLADARHQLAVHRGENPS